MADDTYKATGEELQMDKDKRPKLTPTRSSLSEPTHAAANHVSTVLLDMNNRRKNGDNLCDVTLLVADNKILTAHRNVLVSCSKYFESMFSHDSLLESHEGKVDLIQFSEDVIETLLNFMYTGNLELLPDTAMELMEAAKYLQIDGLLERCCHDMQANLSGENFTNTLNIAELLQLPLIKSATLSYMQQNTCLSFVERNMASFGKLTFDQLVSILNVDDGSVLPKITSEYEIFEIVMRWMKVDFDSRRQFACKLLGDCIRYPLMPLLDLTDRALPEITKLQDHSVANLITDALKYHSRPDLQATRLYAGKQTRLRFADECIASIPNSFRQPRATFDKLTKEITTMPDPETRFLRVTILKLPIGGNTPKTTSKTTFEILHHSAMEELDGFLYVAGGKILHKSSRKNRFNYGSKMVLRYNSRTNTWFQCTNMNTGRYNFTLTAVDGQLFAVGGAERGKRGFFGEEQYTNTVECYDPESNQWRYCEPVGSPTQPHAAVGFRGVLYIADLNGKIQYYDKELKEWIPLQDVDFLKQTLGTVTKIQMYSDENSIYVVSGTDSSRRYLQPLKVCQYLHNEQRWLSYTSTGNYEFKLGYFLSNKLWFFGRKTDCSVESSDGNINAIMSAHKDIDRKYLDDAMTCFLRVPKHLIADED